MQPDKVSLPATEGANGVTHLQSLEQPRSPPTGGMNDAVSCAGSDVQMGEGLFKFWTADAGTIPAPAPPSYEHECVWAKGEFLFPNSNGGHSSSFGYLGCLAGSYPTRQDCLQAAMAQ